MTDETTPGIPDDCTRMTYSEWAVTTDGVVRNRSTFDPSLEWQARAQMSATLEGREVAVRGRMEGPYADVALALNALADAFDPGEAL